MNRALFREGGPTWGVVLALCALPPLLAAPMNVALHASFPLASAFGFIATAAIAWWLRSRLPEGSTPHARLLKHVLGAVVALLACAALYSRPFSGLPNWIGSDGGNHAATKVQLEHGTRDLYTGFVAMHMAWLYTERLFHVSSFWGFAVVFYSQVVMLAAVPLAIGFATLHPFEDSHPRVWNFAAGALAVSTLAGLVLVALPLEHYFQVEGFWPQTYGMVPLLVIWWLDASLELWWHRLIAWSAGVVMFRYAYGLNLPELLGVFGCVALLDIPPKYRRYAIFVAILAGGGTAYALRQLHHVVKTWGWFVGYDVVRGLCAGVAAMGALAVAALGNRAATREMNLDRVVRLPLLFSLGSLIITAFYRFRFRPMYYVFKYPFQSVCLGAVACAVVLAAVVASLRARRGALTRRDLVWGCGTIGLVLTAYALWFSTYAEYHAGYWERLLGRRPAILRPLADLTAWKVIHETVAREKHQFGGYLVSYGPMSNFINSSLGAASGQAFYFEGKPPKMSSGYCTFWDATRPDPWPSSAHWYRQRGVADLLDRGKGNTCVDYPAPWDENIHRRICYKCF